MIGYHQAPKSSLRPVPIADTFYLDIGGSSSLGTQPTGIATHNGHRTPLGYANDLKRIEACSRCQVVPPPNRLSR